MRNKPDVWLQKLKFDFFFSFFEQAEVAQQYGEEPAMSNSINVRRPAVSDFLARAGSREAADTGKSRYGADSAFVRPQGRPNLAKREAGVSRAGFGVRGSARTQL